jgi:putative copper resistance protein D
MAPDAAMVAVRLALYADLMALFGIHAFALWAFRTRPPRSLTLALSLVGLLLSLLGLLMLVASMAALPLAGVDRASIAVVLGETAAGKAIMWRIAFLLLAALAALLPARLDRFRMVAIVSLSGLAVAALAWSGHGAATEGGLGNLHLAADILHLLAAAAWFGALLAFLWLLVRPGVDPVALHRALTRFSALGVGLVGAILLTGLINSWVLVGIANIGALPFMLYGRLLLAKLALFAAMIGLAALNRRRLTPALAIGEVDGNPARAIAALRTSIALETTAAVAILALVAWLGMVEPMAGM